MSFLIPADYKKQIQSDNLNQIIGNDTSILSAAELTAIEEVTSYLTQKYDLTNAFQTTPAWNNAVGYKASNRVYLDAAVYNPAAAYVVGQYTVYNSGFYICTGSTTGTFAPGSWTLINPQYSIYFAQYPFPVFDYNGQYAVDDQVFWKDKTYTCLSATPVLGHDSAIQYGNYQSLPYPNLAPDDVNATQIWGAGTAYTVPAATLITDITKWTFGDNRSQQLLTYLIDMALYHVHSRIAPRSIPELRVKRYDDAKSWLRLVSKGDVTASIPALIPAQGGRIRYGGNIKQCNSY